MSSISGTKKDGESVNLYVVELKILSIHCEFGAFLPEALRDRLVCGLRSETTQKKLFSEANLDFDKAVQISHAKETAEKDILAFFSSETAAHNGSHKIGEEIGKPEEISEETCRGMFQMRQ